MNTGKRVVSLVAILALAGASLVAPASAAKKKCYKGDAKSLARMINDFRADEGVPKLQFDPQLALVARGHAKKMKNTEKVRHMNRGEFEQKVTNWDAITDLVRADKSLKVIFKAWKKDDVARRNMLSTEFNYFGVGILKNDQGTWAHSILSGPGDPGTTVDPDKC